MTKIKLTAGGHPVKVWEFLLLIAGFLLLVAILVCVGGAVAAWSINELILGPFHLGQPVLSWQQGTIMLLGLKIMQLLIGPNPMDREKK